MNRKEFAKYLDVKANHLRSLISKGKIIEENGEIDSNNPINWAFIIKKKDKVVNGTIQSKLTKTPPRRKSANQDSSVMVSAVTTIDHEKKAIEIVKIKADIKLKELEYAKKKAKIIPLRLFASNINTFLIGTVGKVKNELHKFIENEFDDNETALEHKKYISEIIDESIKNNIKSAIDEMQKEADDYSLMTSW